MKIVMEIPQEFEQDFISNQFEDAFRRFIADANLCAGDYEKETAEMLIKSFKESKEYDLDKVVQQLEDKKHLHERMITYEQKNGTVTEEFQQRKAVEVLKDAIDIVKGVEVEIEKENPEGEQEM